MLTAIRYRRPSAAKKPCTTTDTDGHLLIQAPANHELCNLEARITSEKTAVAQKVKAIQKQVSAEARTDRPGRWLEVTGHVRRPAEPATYSLKKRCLLYSSPVQNRTKVIEVLPAGTVIIGFANKGGWVASMGGWVAGGNLELQQPGRDCEVYPFCHQVAASPDATDVRVRLISDASDQACTARIETVSK